MPNPIWSWLKGEDLKTQDRIAELERKLFYAAPLDVSVAIRAGTLVHGPGATEMYEAAWGRGRDGNSAVFACLMALSLAHIEPPLRVARYNQDGSKDWMRGGSVQAFLDDPNPVHDALELRFWTQWARHLDGNAYLRKIRAGNSLTGNVIALWPISPSLITPCTEKGSTNFIDYYKYTYGPGKWEPIPPENMLHFKVGIDDRDHRLGLAPLKRLTREIMSDDEATKFADALLKNYGVPGLVVTMPAGAPALNEDQANDLKAKIGSAFGSENRGNVGVLTAGADIKQFGFNPEQLNLKGLHDIPETRIAAVMGVPTAIAGLSVGLEQSANYASMRQVRENFTEVKLIPTWRMDAAKFNKQLKPDFTNDASISIEYDLTDVRALQEDEDAKYSRLDKGIQGFWIRPSEARAETGYPDDPELDAMWLERAQSKSTPAPVVAAPALPPVKEGGVIQLKAGEVNAETLQALVDLAVPGFSDALEGYLDGARKRVNRALVSGG